jgi:hypothetical protein
MKKLAFLFVAGALALGACSKKKDPAAPAGGDMGNPTDTMGGDAYGAAGGDAYGVPMGENPCGDAANPCG